MAYENGLSMDERVTSLFQPDTLLPDQYLDTFRRKLHLEPEKKLMLAILEDAVACFQKYLFARDSKGKTQFRDTEDWVLQHDDSGVFSFNIVCETLGSILTICAAVWRNGTAARRPADPGASDSTAAARAINRAVA